MSAATGRALVIKRDGTKIGAVVSKSISINNEPIDTSNDDDLGFRTLMEDSGTRSVDISVEGVLKTDALLIDAADPATTALIEAADIVFPSGLILRGDFRLNGIEVSGESAGRVQFSGTLQSTGAWTLIP